MNFDDRVTPCKVNGIGPRPATSTASSSAAQWMSGPTASWGRWQRTVPACPSPTAPRHCPSRQCRPSTEMPTASRPGAILTARSCACTACPPAPGRRRRTTRPSGRSPPPPLRPGSTASCSGPCSNIRECAIREQIAGKAAILEPLCRAWTWCSRGGGCDGESKHGSLPAQH